MKFKMFPLIRCLLCPVCATAISLSSLRAQVVADGATNTLDNVTNFITGSVTIGTNGPFTTLILTNGAQLTNFGSSAIGFNLSSKSNSVSLTGTNTRWSMLGSFYVGYAGAANRLVVSNGAVVQDVTGLLGLDPSSSNNTAVITGAGSGWDNTTEFHMGFAGPGNQLVLSDGGVIQAAFLGTVGHDQSSSSNMMAVMGVGSRWSVNDIRVGNSGAGNQLVVSNGGVVLDRLGALGFDPSSSNNTAVITGAGSQWTNHTVFFVGSSGSGNRLALSDGAMAWNTEGTLGNSTSSSSNSVTVTGVGSAWTNSVHLKVGNSGAGNLLVVTNGGAVKSVVGYLGFDPSGSNNTAVVTGAGSKWVSDFELTVGNAGSGNQLVVTNGGVVLNGSAGYLGYVLSSNNTAVVTGAGSALTNVGDFHVGLTGSGNQLLVTNGGVVNSGNGNIGTAVESANNAAVVTGPGSLWNANELNVGSTGSGNRLLVSNGGAVRNGIGIIGRFGSNNLAVITGAGSGWTNTSTGDFTVGYFGAGNQLVVSNGGVVQVPSSSVIYVGRDIASSNNVVVVTGAGSVWSSSVAELRVGFSGAGNQLVVSNGGVVRNLSGSIGSAISGSSNNVVVVTGAGSVWTNTALLTVGSSGSANQLTVSDGGVVRSLNGIIGGSNNVVVVTGAGSMWTNGSGLTVGNAGSGNMLVVSNGGTVTAWGAAVPFSTVTLGSSSASIDNRIITDGGSLRVTNIGFAVFDIRRGTNVLNAGTNEVDRLFMTNAAGFFEFNGGTLIVRTSTVNNGVVFTVGNGSSAATLQLRGGSNLFTSGLTIANQGVLTGNGIIVGGLTVQSGGALSPGTSVGRLILSNSPSLQGNTLMEISKNGVVRTNDQVQVAGLLTYGGSLTVSDLGPTTLVVGDRFPLFSAATYAGAFTSLNLPSLNAGLGWTNKLLLDGSIEVVAAPVAPKFSNATVVGTDLVISGSGGTPGADYEILTATNIVQPLINWVSLTTNQFDLNGNFTFTNGITPGELQRYFRFRTQ